MERVASAAGWSPVAWLLPLVERELAVLIDVDLVEHRVGVDLAQRARRRKGHVASAGRER